MSNSERQKSIEHLVEMFPDMRPTENGYRLNTQSINSDQLRWILGTPYKIPEILIKRSGIGIVVLLDFT